MLKVVYDTHVIVSAALKEESLPALLLSLGLEGKVRFFVSLALVQEYQKVLERPRFKLGHKEITELMEKINQKAIMVKPTKELDLLKADKSDGLVKSRHSRAGGNPERMELIENTGFPFSRE